MLEKLGSTSVSNEARLMICAARPLMDEKTIEKFHVVLREKLDWSKVKRLAHSHRLEPLFWVHLKEHGRELASEETLSYFENRFIENSKSNLLFSKELLQIISVFERNNILIIPYKGTVLAAQIYDNILLRRCFDIDVLICGRDVNRAKELLIELGYEPEIHIRPHQQKALAWSECDQTFIHKKLNIYLELHWAITPRYFSFDLDTDDLINRLQKIKFLEREILMPSPEDLILILCVNATKEMWERLEWLGGIAQLIKQNERLDWHTLINRAEKLRSSRILLLGLHLAREVFEIELPEKVSALIKKDKVIKKLSEQVYAELFSDKEEKNGVLKTNIFRLKVRESWKDRVRYCVMRLLTPTHPDLNFINLPQTFDWIYYFVRPVRLFVYFIFGKLQRDMSEEKP